MTDFQKKITGEGTLNNSTEQRDSQRALQQAK